MEEQFQSFRKDSPYGTEGLAYTGFSDRLLVEHLNGNIHYQLFCGIMIAPSCPITNYKIISAVRNEIASRLDIDFLQGILASHWKPYLENLHVCRMIRLLEKLIIQRDDIHREYGSSLTYTQDYQKRLSIIRKVLVQEKELFEGRKISDRIVCIDRYYVRPIVRGKETKSVEFGAKVNNIQIDGISFIETSLSRHSMRAYV